MRDGGIGHQALNVRLSDRSNCTKEHRHNGKEGNDLLPVTHISAKGVMHNARKQGHCRDLRRGREERGHRRWRPFVNVRRPHVERRGGYFERKARDQEDEAKDQAERRLMPRCFDDPREQRRSREAISQRRTIKEQAGGQRTKHKVFQTGFRRFRAVAAQ